MTKSIKKSNPWVLFISFLISFHSNLGFSVEFPNYFEELAQQDMDGLLLTERAEAKLEQALLSVIRRLQIPYVDKDGTIQTKDFFAKLEAQVKAKDPGAKVFLSGGVVRSLLGYLYKKVHHAREKNPHQSIASLLDQIIQSTQDIQGLSALGIASDLDILVELSVEGPSRKAEVIAEATEFINSAEKRSGLKDTRSRLKYALVPIGDVKEYHAQTDRASAQGGSSLDWLAFPIGGGSMKVPTRDPEAFHRFILGYYDYLPPESGSSDLSDKQVIRGLRPLLELPFIQLSPSGRKQLGGEMTRILKGLESGRKLSPDALAQFEKMIRNARLEGGHNRFHRFKEGSEAGTEDEIRRLAVAISRRGTETSLPLIPEFLQRRKIRLRKGRDLCELKERGLLANLKQFEDEHTDHGVLYHGTPSILNILSMIRNGFVLSTSKQGRGQNGWGVYLTQLPEVAASYGGNTLELRLNPDPELRVVLWENIRSHPWIVSLAERAKAEGMEVFQYLGEKCDVDVVKVTGSLSLEKSGETLIQNADAVLLPKNATDLIRLQASRVTQALKTDWSSPTLTRTEGEDTLQAIVSYPPYHHLGRLLGIKDLKPVADPSEIIKVLLHHPRPEMRYVGAKFLSHYTAPDGTEVYKQALQSPDHFVQLEVAKNLETYPAVTPELYHLALKSPDPGIRGTAASFLYRYPGEDIQAVYESVLQDSQIGWRAAGSLMQGGEVIPGFIESYLTHSDFRLRVKIAQVLGQYSGPHRYRYFELALSDPNLEVKRAAASGLFNKPGDNFCPLYKRAFKDPDPCTRQKAAEAFGFYISKIPDDCFESLLQDPDPEIRAAVAPYLFKKDNPDPAFKRALEDSILEVRQAAAKALRLYSGSQAHTLFTLAMNDVHADVRSKAASSLASQPSDSLNPLVKKALTDSDRDVRKSIARQFSNPDAREKVTPKRYKVLLKLLTHSDQKIRQEAAALIKEFDPSLDQLKEGETKHKISAYLTTECVEPIEEMISLRDIKAIFEHLK